MTEIHTIYTNGYGTHDTRHDAVGAAAVRGREQSQTSPLEETERVESLVAPVDELADEDWLTTAQDAEEGMTVLLLDDGAVVPYGIDTVDVDDVGTVIKWHTETDGEPRGLTADEIDARPDVVIT